MKFRTDFVTNSSSSSYICEICGDTESGWDLSISDTNFIECEAGHCFCIDHLGKEELDRIIKIEILDPLNRIDLDPMEKDTLLDLSESFPDMEHDNISEVREAFEVLEGNEVIDRYDWPSYACPICLKKAIPDYMLLKFIIEKSGYNREYHENLVRAEFNLDEFLRDQYATKEMRREKIFRTQGDEEEEIK